MNSNNNYNSNNIILNEDNVPINTPPLNAINNDNNIPELILGLDNNIMIEDENEYDDIVDLVSLDNYIHYINYIMYMIQINQNNIIPG